MGLYGQCSALLPTAAAAARQLGPLPQLVAARERWRRRTHSGGASSSGAVAAWMSSLVFAGAISSTWSRDVETCGIVGVVSRKEPARQSLLDGLSILRNRGYDSAGIATIDPEGHIAVSKFASRGSSADSIELLKQNSSVHESHRIGIAHTRWATHGGKSDKNAHPHVDYKNRIALVHNGTLDNFLKLRHELEEKGIEFRSDTDSEVIAHLIGLQLDENPGIRLKDAVDSALRKCEGTWGLAIISHDSPNEIVAARQGSPLVIGIEDDALYISSETSAFARMTQNFVAMRDGEIATLDLKNFALENQSRVERAHAGEEIKLDPAPHPHWTIKECLDQPQALSRSLAYGSRFDNDKVVLGGLDAEEESLRNIQHMTLSACGTSLYASMYGAMLMRSLGSFHTVKEVDAAELGVHDFPKTQGGLLVASQSGETRDVLNSIKKADFAGVRPISIVNVVGSAIARETGLGVYLHAGREQAVASTKAFSSSVVVYALIALWFRQLREKCGEDMTKGFVDRASIVDSLQRLPISFGMALRARPRCKEIAEELLGADRCFIVGKGFGYPIALEGALKLKEMAYLHAEGYSGGAFKHGPFALIEGAEEGSKPTPIIMLIFDDEHSSKMLTAAQEVKARGAKIYVVTDNPELAAGIDQNPIVIPRNGELSALIGVLPLQLIAYELAVLRGINPDTPRNLAKAVTTD